MSESVSPKSNKPQSVLRSHPFAIIRAAIRFVLLLLWVLGCYGLLIVASPLGWGAPVRGKAVRKRIGRLWMRGMSRIIGTRFVVHGTPPEPPFFMVLNHLAWIDIFPVHVVFDARGIVEEPVSRIPAVGALVAATNPIFVRRVKEDTARVNDLMVQAIEAGDSLVIAPETPETTCPRGQGVRMFRGGLLQSAVRTGKPVHYFSVTYRVPAGYPPPSDSMLFGPNPFLRGPDGKIPQSEIDAWGPERSFFPHFLGVLALPWQEIIMTFAPDPIPAGSDRIALANKLHDAVEAIYEPVD